ncbi:EPM2A-interacting protein 1-like [Scomber scombrus]|uniref:EPM2A-interacting protein 1-like n=1 Tax=Scomber scombrus TaxID=13677 RepID=A0AAV1PZJ3_SCOSC
MESEWEPGPSRKKRCVGEEKRRFQDKWTYANLVVPHGSDKVMCLICKQVNAMLKDFNINAIMLPIIKPTTNSPTRSAPEEPAEMQFELSDLQENSKARAACRDKNLIEFYKGLSPSTYPALRQHAIRMVSLFGSTYICEKTFTTMAINKSKLRSRLTDGHLHAVLRIATTEMEPDIRGIVANQKQHHKSHANKKRFSCGALVAGIAPE